MWVFIDTWRKAGEWRGNGGVRENKDTFTSIHQTEGMFLWQCTWWESCFIWLRGPVLAEVKWFGHTKPEQEAGVTYFLVLQQSGCKTFAKLCFGRYVWCILPFRTLTKQKRWSCKVREAGEHVICQSAADGQVSPAPSPRRPDGAWGPRLGHGGTRITAITSTAPGMHRARGATPRRALPAPAGASRLWGLQEGLRARRRCLPAWGRGWGLPPLLRGVPPSRRWSPLREPARAQPPLRAAQAQCAGRGRGAQAQSAPRSRAVAAAGSLRGGCDCCSSPGRRGVGSPVPARGRRHTKERGDRPSRHTPQK